MSDRPVPGDPERMRDLVVIGAGPAGRAAAKAAAGAGLDVLSIDDQPAPRGRTAGGVEWLHDHVVWSVAPGFRVDALGGAGTRAFSARAVLAATGSDPRIVPFPGWTLPGVEPLARAPRRVGGAAVRVLVAGSGPELYAVATGLLAGGTEVAAVVDHAAAREWLGLLPDWPSDRRLGREASTRLGRLVRHGVPILRRHAVRRASATPGGGLRLTVAPVDAQGGFVPGAEARHFGVERLFVGQGATPSTDVTRLMRAEHRFDPARGGWVPVCDALGRTSVAGLFVAGDTARIAGAEAARASGCLAGLALAHDLGALSAAAFERRAGDARRRLERGDRLARGLARLTAPRPGAIDAIAADTIVCPCEGVTRAAIEAARDDGAMRADQLKAWTRCGMGPCQGRICGDIAAAILAGRRGSRAAIGCFTGRTPLRPLPLGRLAGDCDYADIRLPPPAPL